MGRYADMSGYSRFYFVTHSPDKILQEYLQNEPEEDFIFWGVEELAQQAVNNGLVRWLIDKAS